MEDTFIVDLNTAPRSSLPLDVEKRIPGNYRIVGWWRRAGFEVVEEWAITIYRTILIFFLARWWLVLFQVEPGPMFVAAVVIIFLVYAFRIGFFEHMRWLREIYVVCEDMNYDGGSVRGRIYKFTGSHILQITGSSERLSDAITSSWPSAYDRQSNLEKVWYWLTGEQMVKVTLVGPSEAYLTGRRVHPNFLKAIEKVQGSRPKKVEAIDDARSLFLIDRILDSFERQVISKQETRAHLRAILAREIYHTETTL